MISIIIPTLNEEKYLPKLFENIKKQNLKDYEIIVADADSKDKTRQIAKKFKCKVVKGGSPPQGRNNGAKKAKGKFLFFIDADSLLSKNFFNRSLKQIKKRDLSLGSCKTYPLSTNLIDKIYFGLFNFWIMATQYFYPNASGSCIFCSKEIHNKIKGFDEKIKLSEDMDYVKRASKYGKFGLLKNAKAYTSVRRFEVEGRFKLGLKLFLSAIYRLIFGEIRSDIFKYGFRYKK